MHGRAVIKPLRPEIKHQPSNINSTRRTNYLTMVNRCRSAGAAFLIGCCILASVLFSFDLIPFNNHEDPSLLSSSAPELQRYLMATAKRRILKASIKTSSSNSVRSWANNHLEPVTVSPDPSRETVLFWHIPKSGGTTIKRIYACLHQTLSVDTTTIMGIRHAEEMRLVPSGLADLIITGNPAFAIKHLYDDAHKGRVLALFRHPVDRLVSKFYYLQTAWVMSQWSWCVLCSHMLHFIIKHSNS